MSALPVLVGTVFTIVVIAAAALAVSTRDARIAVIGLLVALLAAPFVAEPVPDLRGIGARLAGAVLGTYPLWMIYRGREEPTTGSRGGAVIDGMVAVVAALAAASAAVGWDVAGQLNASGLGGLITQLGKIGTGLEPPFLPAIGAGGALLVLAVSPVAFAREPLRLTLGLTLAMLGVTLVEAGLAGPPTPFTNLCVALALAAVSAGGGVVILASRRSARPLPKSSVNPVLRALPPLHLPTRGERGRRGPVLPDGRRVPGGLATRPEAPSAPATEPPSADPLPVDLPTGSDPLFGTTQVEPTRGVGADA